MEKFNIPIEGTDKTIQANDKICTGFYAADETNVVEQNIKTLKIEFKNPSNNDEPQHSITKVGECAFVTTKAEHGYMQHIILPSIDEKGFYDYANKFQHLPHLYGMLLQAFNLKGRMTLGSIRPKK